MPDYHAPLEEFDFLINEFMDGPELHTLKGYEDATPDMIATILEEADKFTRNELLPLNQSGDEEGCRLEDGVVYTPSGFKEAYRQFVEGGWGSLSCAPEYGGQGLPMTLSTAISEMLCSSNFSFSMYPGLTQGAFEAIESYGSEKMKNIWLPNMASGEWSGAMCLTEPHCGTDLGLMRTKASPATIDALNFNSVGEDLWAINGTKIFITAGDHDLTSNIIYLVLARLPDAPEGIKGVSLFLVPKYHLDENHQPVIRNEVKCGALENKMGIKASATCVMNFDGALGWLVGEPHKGMRAMFRMMNAARLGVAVQGTAIGEAAYQAAASYAKERRQGRSLSGVKEPDKAADPIIVHPDIRRMLMTMRVYTTSSRALEMMIAKSLDISYKASDTVKRQDADDYVALMTPIAKAFFTDLGSKTANLAVQIYGGHGYIRDHGVEQFIRDARIAQIYEGANGIQALDLVGRKMPMYGGRLLRSFFHPVQAYIEANGDNETLQEFIMPLAKSFGRLQIATATIAQRGMRNPDEGGAASYDYLCLFGHVAFAHIWARMAEIAIRRLKQDTEEHTQSKAFYENRLIMARFFMARVLPRHSAHFSALMAGGESLMTMKAESF